MKVGEPRRSRGCMLENLAESFERGDGSRCGSAALQYDAFISRQGMI